MSELLILPKPKISKPFKVGIVGCDGRSIKTKEQEEKIKYVIESILHGVDFKIQNNFSKLPECYKGDSRISWYWIYGRQSELTLVSGGCSIGEKQWYCVDCDEWLDKAELHRYTTSDIKHKIIKIYDKGGVDTFAEIIATKLSIPTDIKRPEVNQWNDSNYCSKCPWLGAPITKKTHKFVTDHPFSPKKGFRSRNIDIIEANNVLYDIEVKGDCRHCGGRGYHPLSLEKEYKENKPPKGLLPFPFQNKNKCKWCKGTGTYSGGTWTYLESLKRGKEVYQVIIE